MMTVAGFFADEVVLQPESFVTQAIGRCSVEGSKIWFSANPDNPHHYVYREFILKAKEKNALHLHFTMHDNPSLSQKVIERYERMFTGVFYKRNILGEWVIAEGLVYPSFDHQKHVVKDLPGMRKYWVGVDYGHQNGCVFLLGGVGDDDKFYVIDEYYHSGRESGRQKSPEQYAKDMKKWLDKIEVKPEYIFVDPSAKGFMLQLYDEGIRTAKGNNDVKSGIEFVSSTITSDKLRIHHSCVNLIKEFHTYAWDEKASERGEDKPIKKGDDSIDALRYLLYSDHRALKKYGISDKSH